MELTQSEMVEAIYSSLPYASQIENLNLKVGHEVRFSWRGGRYMVTNSLSVWEIDDYSATGTREAMILSELLKLKHKEQTK